MKVSAKGDYQQPPAGAHVARCVSLIDLGTQSVQWQGTVRMQHKVLFVWELPEALMEDGRPFTVRRKYTMSLNKNAALLKDLESWRGRKFTKEELAGFELKAVLGATCVLNLVEDGEYVNVASIAPLAKKQKAPKQVNESVFFSLEPKEFDVATFTTLSDKTRELITASPEYKALVDVQEDATQEHDADAPPADADDDRPF